jgi:hypothetical protein
MYLEISKLVNDHTEHVLLMVSQSCGGDEAAEVGFRLCWMQALC